MSSDGLTDEMWPPRVAGRFRALAGAGLLLAPPAFAQPVKWDMIPTMQLERLYRGPLRDTIVQRWRDPLDGTVCYLFIPINAPHSPPNETGYVQYGPTTIGSISCVASAGKAVPPAEAKQSGGVKALPKATAPAARPANKPPSPEAPSEPKPLAPE